MQMRRYCILLPSRPCCVHTDQLVASRGDPHFGGGRRTGLAAGCTGRSGLGYCPYGATFLERSGKSVRRQKGMVNPKSG